MFDDELWFGAHRHDAHNSLRVSDSESRVCHEPSDTFHVLLPLRGIGHPQCQYMSSTGVRVYRYCGPVSSFHGVTSMLG